MPELDDADRVTPMMVIDHDPGVSAGGARVDFERLSASRIP
jgi:hypothetical protein